LINAKNYFKHSVLIGRVLIYAELYIYRVKKYLADAGRSSRKFCVYDMMYTQNFPDLFLPNATGDIYNLPASTPSQPADVHDWKRMIKALKNVSKLNISSIPKLCWTCMKEDMPMMA